MPTRQYVGARYVPKFSNPLEWEPNTNYEALTIVTYNGNSYTSKVPVPASVGNPTLNSDYWANTGNYNAQLNEINNKLSNYTPNYSVFSKATGNDELFYVRGFNSEGDGGNGFWFKTEANADNYTIKTINGNNYKLIYDDGIYPEQIGAYGDNEHDDKNYFQFLLDNNIKVLLRNNVTYYCSTLCLHSQSIIEGNNVENEYTQSGGIRILNPITTLDSAESTSTSIIGCKISGVTFFAQKGTDTSTRCDTFTNGSYQWCTFDYVAWRNFHYVFNSTLLGCWIKNFWVAESSLGIINGSDNTIDTGFVGYNPIEKNDTITGNIAQTTITHCYFNSATTGEVDHAITLNPSSSDVNITDNIFNGFGKSAINLTGNSGTQIKNTRIVNNTFLNWSQKDDSDTVINISYAFYTIITNNFFDCTNNNNAVINGSNYPNYGVLNNNKCDRNKEIKFNNNSLFNNWNAYQDSTVIGQVVSGDSYRTQFYSQHFITGGRANLVKLQNGIYKLDVAIGYPQPDKLYCVAIPTSTNVDYAQVGDVITSGNNAQINISVHKLSDGSQETADTIPVDYIIYGSTKQ